MKRLLIVMLLVGFSDYCYPQELTDQQVANMGVYHALSFASFLNQQFPPADDWQSNGAGADFFNNRYRQLVRQPLVVRGLMMRNMNFQGLFLRDIYFQYCDLSGTDFSGGFFEGGHFLVCNLDQTRWVRSFLGNAKFFGISEMEADSKYPLGNTTMRGADIDLSGSTGLVSFDSVDMTSTVFIGPVVDPANLGEAIVVFAECNMRGFAVRGDAKSLVFRRCINLNRDLYDENDKGIREENKLPRYSKEAEETIGRLMGNVIDLLMQIVNLQFQLSMM